MAATVDDETTKQDNFVEKSCPEITPSEKRRNQIRDGSSHSCRQKFALVMGTVQIISYILLCVPLFLYKEITFCSVPAGMIIVYILVAFAVLGHIFLIITACRKLRPGGLWIPMAVQICIGAVAAVQLYVMIKMYTGSTDISKQNCPSEKKPSDEVLTKDVIAHKSTVGAGLCLLAFSLAIAAFITNILLYIELNEIQKEEHNRQNQLVVDRQNDRISKLHSIIYLQERREVDAANEAIKTAQETELQGNKIPADTTQPKSASGPAKSKHRMIE